MEIFFYIALWGAVVLSGLFLKRTRAHLPHYAGLTLLFSVAVFVLYVAVSQWAGIVRFGMVTDRRVPQDYFDNGAGGFVAFLVLVLGVLSPLAAAWISGRLKTGKQT